MGRLWKPSGCCFVVVDEVVVVVVAVVVVELEEDLEGEILLHILLTK